MLFHVHVVYLTWQWKVQNKITQIVVGQ